MRQAVFNKTNAVIRRITVGRLVVVCFCFALNAEAALGATNYSLSYSGRLTQQSGAAVEGPIDIQVSFWSSNSGGTQRGETITYLSVELNQGVFAINLDLRPDQLKAIFGDGSEAVFVEISAAGKVYPRQQYLFVPFALRVPTDNTTLAFNDDGKLGFAGASSPTPNSYLSADGSGKLKWVSLDASSLSAKTADNLAPTNGQVLTYNGTKWVAAAGASGPSGSGGTVTSVSGTAPISVATGSTTPVISMAQASGSASGYLSYGDWNAFNSKQEALGYVPVNKSGDTMSGALSVPLLTQAGTAAPSVAAAGQGSIYFDSGSNQFKVSQNGSAYAPLVNAASVTRVEAGTGLTGGAITTAGTISLANTTVTAGSYSRATITVDQQGRLTAAASSPAIVDADISPSAAIAQSKISGLVSALTGKEQTIVAGTSSQYWRGDKTWQTLNTTSVPEGSNQYFTVARAVSSLSSTAPISYSTTTGNIAISKASGSSDGYLSASDWSTFNNKQDAISYTPLNKSGDTMSGALNMNGQPLSAVGNVVLSAAKTLGLGVFDNTSEPLMTAQLNSSGAASPDKGKTWFNSSTNQIKYWDGSGAQALGVSGSGLSSFNGQTGNTQTLTVPGTSGTAPAWSSASNAHTLNIPLASTASVTAGLISNSDYNSFNGKVAGVTSGTGVTVSTTGNIATVNLTPAGTAGNYSKVTTDAYGRVTSGTSLSAADIPPLSAASITSGTLTVANGGTGATILATNSVILGNGTSAVQTVTPGTSGNVLTSNGTTWQSTALPASVTSVSGTAPISVATGTSTPVISISQANGSTDGYLSSADWNAFNSKQSSGNYISALTGDVTAAGPGSAAATLAAVAVPGTSTKVTYDVKGRVTSGTSLTAADIPPLSAASITSGTLSASNGGTGISSTATFPSSGVIVTESAAETLTNKTLTGATINGASSIAGSTSINTSGAITSGVLTAATIVSQGNLTLQGNGTNASRLVLNDKGTNYLALKSPDTLAASTTWVLPSADGTGGQVLATNGSGTLGWVSGLAPTGVAGGDLSGNFPNPTVANVGGVTAVNVAASANLANAATNANTASTIVKRDSSGNFAAGTITGNLTGNVTGNLTGNASTATSAGSFTGSLAGDVTGTQGATVVDSVGGVTAANVAAGAGLANAATNVNISSTIVKRDSSGNFSAGTITGNLTGNVTGNLSGNVTGNVSGTATNVTGTVAVANGGTGVTTLAANSVLLGNGASAPLTVAPGASGNVLVSNGTTWTSSASATNWAAPGAIGATTPSSAAFTTLTASGNVGIGTTNPLFKLDVAGNTRIGAPAGPNTLEISDIDTAEWRISTGGYGLSFANDFDNNATYDTRIFFSKEGNVGIGTTAPGANLDVNGSIKSPMWKATQLMNSTPGALPLTSASFTTGGGTLMIFASGAGYAVTLQQIGMSIAIDNVVKGYAKSFTNETSSHKAFAANAVLVTGIAAGSHTITLSAWNNTVTNFDDFFSVTVLELPF